MALPDVLEQREQLALTADDWPRLVSALTISDSPELVIAGEQAQHWSHNYNTTF